MLAELVARFCALLREEGLAVGPDRAARFARSVVEVSPSSAAELYWCAQATLTSAPGDTAVLDRVFAAVFGQTGEVVVAAGAGGTATVTGSGGSTARRLDTAEGGRASGRDVETPSLGSAVERLAARDFAELDESELAQLAEAMRRFRIATPLRVSRRHRAAAAGRWVDMRETLRRARRTGAEPVLLRRRVPRYKPRKLVVLCDISGSMQAQARAMLQVLVCAAGGAKAEVFTFATRLTRITHVLARDPATALREAGEAAPDWSGGTRIGASLREFLDRHGARGLARGAVVVLISDGWEAGDPAELETQLARLRRIAHRVVWVNPRTAKRGYRPLAGGMAAAWPYCDAVVSAHRLDAVDELVRTIRDVG
ncbi:vWA domain-containing protein [Prauserella cavernicola]|uniref:VWA domain-containing protein n=1 Tax=Prauserella cavernicola TaxID=2800127 RepID=A0A934V936_9PSEU|nr:VWA domain-containing protein [Prauserella cavernicola]MBK1789309.1 VWA domain-containing protein [Prauserella cavernicola]